MVVHALNSSTRKQRQVDFYEFQDSQGYKMRPCLKHTHRDRVGEKPYLIPCVIHKHTCVYTHKESTQHGRQDSIYSHFTDEETNSGSLCDHSTPGHTSLTWLILEQTSDFSGKAFLVSLPSLRSHDTCYFSKQTFKSK